MSTRFKMQGVVNGALVSWLALGPDFDGASYTGTGTPTDVMVYTGQAYTPPTGRTTAVGAASLATPTGAGTGTSSAGIVLSRFSSGGYWDFRTLGGIAGDAVTATIPSAIGSNVITPTGSPTIDDTAIGGGRALMMAGGQQLRCDALGSRVNHGNAWTMVIRTRQTLSTYNPLFCAGNSTGSGNYFQAIHLPGTQSIQLLTNSPANGVVARVGSKNMEFDEHDIIVTSDGTSLEVYIDGVTEPLDVGTMDPTTISCDRFAFGGVISSVASSWFTGPISFCAFTFDRFTAADALAMHNHLLAGDALLPIAQRKQIAPCGDSITATSIYTKLGAGNREYLIQWVTDHRLSLRLVGQFAYGSMPNRHCVAVGGNDMQTIATNFATALGDPMFRPDVVRVQMGTNNMSDNTTPAAQATHLATFRTYINQMRNDAHTAGLNPKFVIATIPPFSTAVLSGVSQTNAAAFNVGLQAASTGEFAVFAAAFPGELVANPDFYVALGSAWSLAYYDNYPTGNGIPYGTAGSNADSTHPNEYGVQVMGASEILAAGLTYRSLSPTIIPLACWVKSYPSVASGASATISGRCTRYPSTLNLYRNGTLWGAATMSKQGWTFTGTAPAAGTYSLTAVVTDTLDGTTATSAAVSFVVT